MIIDIYNKCPVSVEH